MMPAKKNSMNEIAFRSGARAHAAGKSLKDCPYSGQRLTDQWIAGFQVAQSKGGNPL